MVQTTEDLEIQSPGICITVSVFCEYSYFISICYNHCTSCCIDVYNSRIRQQYSCMCFKRSIDHWHYIYHFIVLHTCDCIITFNYLLVKIQSVYCGGEPKCINILVRGGKIISSGPLVCPNNLKASFISEGLNLTSHGTQMAPADHVNLEIPFICARCTRR